MKSQPDEPETGVDALWRAHDGVHIAERAMKVSMGRSLTGLEMDVVCRSFKVSLTLLSATQLRFEIKEGPFARTETVDIQVVPALRSYARSWTAELAPRGIRVNVVSPGPSDTAMFAAVAEDARAAITSQIPLGCMARVDEVAAAAAFLLSDDASFIAGAELCVDGGANQV